MREKSKYLCLLLLLVFGCTRQNNEIQEFYRGETKVRRVYNKGKLIYEYQYFDSIYDYVKTDYYDNGAKKSSKSYYYDTLNGVCNEFYRNGEEKMWCYWYKGVPVGENIEYYNETDLEMCEKNNVISIADQTIKKYSFYNTYGELRFCRSYDIDGKLVKTNGNSIIEYHAKNRFLLLNKKEGVKFVLADPPFVKYIIETYHIDTNENKRLYKVKFNEDEASATIFPIFQCTGKKNIVFKTLIIDTFSNVEIVDSIVATFYVRKEN